MTTTGLKLMADIAVLGDNILPEYALTRAMQIVRATPGDSSSWDDPEAWVLQAAELAHAVVRLLNLKTGSEEDLAHEAFLAGHARPVANDIVHDAFDRWWEARKQRQPR